MPHAFTHCPNCRFQYRTELVDGEMFTRRVKLVLFVARDTIGLFLLMQAVIAVTALLVHVIDTKGVIAKLYPEKWATTHAASHLAIGPYYVTTCLGYLALLGFAGMVLTCTGRMPSMQREARHRPRWRRPRDGSCCDNGCPTCDCGDSCFWCYVYSPGQSPSCCEGYNCAECCNCGQCAGGGGDCGEAGGTVDKVLDGSMHASMDVLIKSTLKVFSRVCLRAGWTGCWTARADLRIPSTS